MEEGAQQEMAVACVVEVHAVEARIQDARMGVAQRLEATRGSR